MRYFLNCQFFGLALKVYAHDYFLNLHFSSYPKSAILSTVYDLIMMKMLMMSMHGHKSQNLCVHAVQLIGLH